MRIFKAIINKTSKRTMADSTNGSDDIVHHEANTKAFIGTRDLGVGDLYICKR